MATARLHCPACGRGYSPLLAVPPVELHCVACGGPLADGAPARRVRREKDAWRRKVIAAARLRKRLYARPGRLVYRATHLQMRSAVRVEVFPEPFAAAHEDHLRRTFAGAALTCELRSVHVVTVMDVGRRTDCWFIITELLPSDLRSRLATGGPLAAGRALRLAEQVLQGLVAVHEAGAVHGNVTPDGVLLGHDGSAKLDRLGGAALPEEWERLCVHERGGIVGPALYAAPERMADDGEADIRSDLYSLGATLYEAVSGRPPYLGTAAGVLRRHAEADVPDLSRERPGAAPEIGALCARLMAKDPAERPQTPEEALDELRECGVELSRRKVIGPVQAAATPSERKYAAVKWTAAWTVVTMALVALALAPVQMMCRQRYERKAARLAAELPARHRVLVVVHEADPLLKDHLPEEVRRAVSAVIAYRLAFCPELEPAGTLGPEQLRAAEGDLEEILREADAQHLLAAAHAPGMGRRRWTLTFVSPDKEPWKLSAECAMESGAAAPFEEAVRKLLAGAAARLSLPESGAAAPAVRADAAAWAELGAALEAERAGQWDRALARARQAGESAPEADPFRVLSAFFAAVASARTSGAFPAVGGLPREGLPPELAALGGVLEALADGPPERAQERLAEFLLHCPRSARGYVLLGLWRLHGEARPQEAAVAFQHAFELDATYVAAARLYLETVVARQPQQADAFLQGLRERGVGEEVVSGLTQYADSLKQGEGEPGAAGAEGR